MTINRISSLPGAEAVQPAEGGREKFGKLLEQAKGGAGPEAGGAPAGTGPAGAGGTEARSEVSALRPAEAVGSTGESVPMQQTVKMVDEVNAAQNRLDQILALAESGKTFSPAELLAFQAHVYRASQELDLAGKVVEKATSGVKQLLQTQL
jgi:hypothetical protein